MERHFDIEGIACSGRSASFSSFSRALRSTEINAWTGKGKWTETERKRELEDEKEKKEKMKR
jgi:hypothetical protein